jgi:uncharacterized cupin superfamily protein
MDRKPAAVWRSQQLAESEVGLVMGLSPSSSFRATPLASLAGLQRAGVNLVRVPPGGQAYAPHAHRFEEEWLYVLEGRCVCVIDGQPQELGPGDFVAFPAPGVWHVVHNPFEQDVRYLTGGERLAVDVLDYPETGASYVLLWDGTRSVFHRLGPPETPMRRE